MTLLKMPLPHKCPVCGCMTVISETREKEHPLMNNPLGIRFHANGQCWESRTFACRQRVDWIPNFERYECAKYYSCTNNESYKKKKQMQDALDKKIDKLRDEKEKIGGCMY